jgi:hypothetical protein
MPVEDGRVLTYKYTNISRSAISALVLFAVLFERRYRQTFLQAGLSQRFDVWFYEFLGFPGTVKCCLGVTNCLSGSDHLPAQTVAICAWELVGHGSILHSFCSSFKEIFRLIAAAAAIVTSRSFRQTTIEQMQGYACVGDKEAALKYLELAVERHDFGATSMKQTPYLDSLHGDPRFAALERRVGLDP